MRGGVGEGGGRGFALGGDFAFYVFEGVASLGVEVWVTEGPALEGGRERVRMIELEPNTTYMFPELVIIRIFYLPNKHHHHKAQKRDRRGPDAPCENHTYSTALQNSQNSNA